MAEVKIILGVNETQFEAEEALQKAIISKYDVSKLPHPDPVVEELTVKFSSEYNKMLAAMIAEIFDVLKRGELGKSGSFEKSHTVKYLRREGTPGDYKYIYDYGQVQSFTSMVPPEFSQRSSKYKGWKIETLSTYDEQKKPLKTKVYLTNPEGQYLSDKVFSSVDEAKSHVDNQMEKSLKGKVPTFTGHKLEDKIRVQGMDISIENKKGSKRHWKDEDGNEGDTEMKYDYGYIRNTQGKDKDHIDVYIGPNQKSERVFIVHQIRPDTRKHDEDKVMLGWDTEKEAKEAYLDHIPEKWFGSIDEMNIEKFKEKVIGKKVNFVKSIV